MSLRGQGFVGSHGRYGLRVATGTLGVLGLVGFLACSGEAGTTVRPSVPGIPTVPPVGTAQTLDLACWNLEWFGDGTYGPTDETLQLQNVKGVLRGMDCDLWALEEVVSATAFQSLLSDLPGYAGLLANDPRVAQGSTYYGATEQKVALVYKTSLATVESAQIILTDHDTDFAGRPPLEVRLRVALNGRTETLYVVCLHAKAGSDSSSYQRRVNAAAALKTYLDTVRSGETVVVLGDFNDDLDASIVTGQPSPYQAFVTDTVHWFTPTKALSDAGVSSLLGYADPVDHHLVTRNLTSRLVPGSVQAFPAHTYVTAYATTTSDHLPVVSRWTVP